MKCFKWNVSKENKSNRIYEIKWFELSGRFFFDGQDENHFAVGAPGANKLLGRVYLCPNCFGSKSSTRSSRRVPNDGVIFDPPSIEIDGDQVIGKNIFNFDLY